MTEQNSNLDTFVLTPWTVIEYFIFVHAGPTTKFPSFAQTFRVEKTSEYRKNETF